MEMEPRKKLFNVFMKAGDKRWSKGGSEIQVEKDIGP